MLGRIKLPKLLIAVSAFLLFFCLIYPIHSLAITYYSKVTGDWDVASTWTIAGCGGGADAGPPGAADNAVICDGHTVLVTQDETIVDLTVNAGGRFDGSGIGKLTMTGNLVVNGTIIATDVFALTGSGTTMDGIGTISTSDAVEITNDKTILSTANITFQGEGRFTVLSGTITNNGIVILDGRLDGAGTWTNAVNSTLDVGVSGSELAITTFNASASGNTVNFYSSDDQNVRCPLSSTYHHLSISGIGIKKLKCDIVINGNLTINSGTLDANTYNMNIKGNWSNQGGVFVEGTKIVEFDGTGAQSITTVAVETFYNFTTNKSSGTLTLNNNVIISNIDSMKLGNINAGSNKLTLGTSIADVGTLVYTSGSVIGKFERWINATGSAILFPVGTAADYFPASITFTNLTSGSLIAEFVSSDPGSNGLSLVDGGVTIYNTFVEGYWNFQSANDLSSTDYDIDLTGNGFTSFPITSATRILTRETVSDAWEIKGTHVDAVGNTAKRIDIASDFHAQHCFGDTTDCTSPSTSPITGTADVCASTTGVNYSITSLRTSTYTWTINGGAANPVPGANDTSITVDWGATGMVGEVQVVENNGCSSGAPVKYSVNIHSLPPSSITGKTSVPESAVGETYSVTAQAGYTYTWTISGGTSDPNPATGQGTNSITVNWGAAGTGNVSVVADSGGCASAPAVDIDVNVYVVIFSIATDDWDAVATWDCNCIPLITDNVVITTHTVTLQADTTINNFTINGTGTLDANGKNFTVTGDITINGTYGGTASTLTLEGINKTISGTGSITNSGGITINTGAKTILNTAVLTKSSGDVTIDAVTVTNNGSITLGGSLIGIGAAVLTNAASSTLNIGSALLTTGTLIASASGNTVNYNGSGAQTIKTPNGSPAQYHHFTVSNTGTKTIGAALDINGNLSISGTSQLDAANNNITLAGNWVNTSTNANPFVEGTGTVTFDGSTDQVINSGSTNDERYNNLTINKSGGNIIPSTASDVIIANSLTFTKGIIRADINSTTVEFVDNATSNGGDADSYVDGPVKKIGNDVFVFPIGDSTIWARIAITNPSSATDAFTAQYFASAHADANNTDATLNNSSVLEYWTLDRTAGVSGVQVTLYWEDSARSGINDAATTDLVVARYNGSNWVDVGQNAITNNDPGDVTSNSVTSFSPFTFASKGAPQNPLPINLLYFDAILDKEEGMVDLTWATASERNNNYFTVEKSIDGADFEFVTYIAGAGNSSHKLYYTAIDDDPYYGVSYYRLKQTDFDGKYEYSKVVAINYLLDEDYNIAVYPNPSDGSFYVNISGNKDEEVLVVVVDVLGREHYSKVIILDEGEYILAVDPYDKLPSGVYIITATSKNNLYRKRIVISP